jgi:hypothetical protein
MAFRSTGNTIISDVQNGTFNSVTFRNFFNQKSQVQGFNFGYFNGGTLASIPQSTTLVTRFPFAVPTTNATDVGNLTQASQACYGHSSSINGYVAPGSDRNSDKFPFSSTFSVAVVINTLTVATGAASSQSSVTHGYTTSGAVLPFTPGSYSNKIEKFSFASEVASLVGVLPAGAAAQTKAGQSSLTHGYTAAGLTGTPAPTTTLIRIDRFPFASDTNAVFVGNLTGTARDAPTPNISSAEHGYVTGGFPSTGANFTVIDRYPFTVSTTNATNIGNLTGEGRHIAVGQSSLTHGYTSGGLNNSVTAVLNIIERFIFTAATTTSADVGDLTSPRSAGAGNQY